MSRSERALLRERDVVPYLLRLHMIDTESIVDGGIRVIDASRRNCNFHVIRDAGPSYVLKRSRRESHDSIGREALVYRTLSATDRRGIGDILPTLRGFDPDAGILILERLSEMEDLRQYHRRLRRFPKWIGAQLGVALADLHGEAVREAVLDSQPDLVAPEPAAFYLHRPGLPLVRDVSKACSELVQLLQVVSDVGEILESVRAEWRTDAFIHQDCRWDNILAHKAGRRRGRLKIIDWESAGFGDPAWDLGSLFGDYLGFWLLSIPMTGHAPPDTYLDLAYPLAAMQPAIRACWGSYLGRARPRGSVEELLVRTTRYAGLKLMQTALESVDSSSSPEMPTYALMQLGVNIVKRPVDGANTLLGIGAP